jgi:hypothetical protein
VRDITSILFYRTLVVIGNPGKQEAGITARCSGTKMPSLNQGDVDVTFVQPM